MSHVAIIGVGSVGRALGDGLSAAGHHVEYGVRDATDPRHGDLPLSAEPAAATTEAEVVILAVPAGAVPDAIPPLGLRAGQVLVDTTNAVGAPIPGDHATVGELTASLLPDGVAYVKAFNTIAAERLRDGHLAGHRLFLPVAGDRDGVERVLPLAADLGFEAVALGGREAVPHLEAHARLWIHLAFGGWGREWGFAVVRAGEALRETEPGARAQRAP